MLNSPWISCFDALPDHLRNLPNAFVKFDGRTHAGCALTKADVRKPLAVVAVGAKMSIASGYVVGQAHGSGALLGCGDDDLGGPRFGSICLLEVGPNKMTIVRAKLCAADLTGIDLYGQAQGRRKRCIAVSTIPEVSNS